MIDPFVQQNQASMHMNAWQGYTSNPNMMSGGSQGYMSPSSAMNMQNMYGGGGSSTWSSPYAPMYDNPFTSSFMMDRTNLLSKPAGAHAQSFRAHMENIQGGATSALASTGMEIGGGFAGSALGAMVGSALIPIPGVGAMIGGIAGSMLGSSGGGALGEMYANRSGRQLETHRSMMGLANNDSPYGGGFGYSLDDAKKVHGKMEEAAIEDPYFSVGEVTRIMDEGIKSGNIKGGQGVGDITSKIKGLKDVAKSLVEIFGGSDIGEIMDTLRRLNSGGLSNGAAVEASHAVGSAARKYGMDATNLMGNLLQEGEVSSSQGSPFSAIDSAMFKVDMMELVKADPDLANKLGNNEEQREAFANVEKAYTALASGQAGTLATGMNIASSENVYGMLAVGKAYSKAGGQEEFDKLDHKEQSKLVSDSFSEVKNDHLSGKKTLGKMIEDRVADRSFTSVDAINIFNSNQQAMKQFSGAHSRALHDNKDYGATRTMSRFATAVMKSPELKTAAMQSLNSKDRAIIRSLASGMDEVESNRGKSKKDLQRSAAMDSGSFEKQWQGGLTAVNQLFGTFIDGLINDVKKLSSGSVKVSDVSTGVANAATAKAGNNVEFAKVHANMSKRAGAGFEEMTGTGDRDASFTNYLPGFSGTYSPERKVLQSMSTQAGLSRQDVGKGMLGAFSAVGWDSLTKAVGAFGFATVDHEEVASMAKSGNQTKRSQANVRSQNTAAFEDFKAGKIDFATFSEKTRKSDKGLTEGLDKFVAFAKKEDLENAPRALAKREEFKQLKESGVLSFYEAADLERNETAGAEGARKKLRSAYNAIVDDKTPENLTASSEQHLSAMQGIMKVSMKAKKSVVEAVGVADTLDYKALASSIDSDTIEGGVDSFIKGNKKLNSLDDQTKGFLATALKYSGGDKAKTMDALNVSYDKAEALMYSGQDGRSAATVYNVGYSGSGNKQEFQNFSKALQNTSVSGIHRNAMKSLNIKEQEAKDLSKDMATVIRDNADSMAINDVTDQQWVSTLYKKTTEGIDDPLGKAILKDDEAAKATMEWAQIKDKDKQARILEAAKHISKVTDHTKDSKITDQAKANQTHRQFSDLTDEEFAMSKKMGAVKELGEEEGTVNDFARTAIGTVAIGAENQRNRLLFGENLNTTDRQASAMGIAGLFDADEKGRLTKMTSEEIKAKYDAIGDKKFEDQDFTERVLSKAMNNVTGSTKQKKEAVTGDQLLAQAFSDSGRSHMSGKTLEDRSRGKGQSPVESVLNEINTKMSALVNNTAKKDQKTDSSNITSENYKLGINSTYDNGLYAKKDPSITKVVPSEKMTPVDKTKVDPAVVAPADKSKVTPVVAEPVNKTVKPEPAEKPKTIDPETKKESKPLAETKKPTPAVVPPSAQPVVAVDGVKTEVAPEKKKTIAKDMVDMKDISGVPKNSVLSLKNVNFDGLKKDTSEMMIRAKNIFAKSGMNMVVTSGSEDADEEGAGRKANSRHKIGKAFDVSTRQFKNKEEASKFGKELQEQLQAKYGGGVRVHGEKDHMHVSFWDKESDGGYSEDKDAYTAKTFGMGRNLKNVQSSQLNIESDNLDQSKKLLAETVKGATKDTVKDTDHVPKKAIKHKKTPEELVADFKAATIKHDKPFGEKLKNGNYRIYEGGHTKGRVGKTASTRPYETKAQKAAREAEQEAAKAEMKASMIVTDISSPAEKSSVGASKDNSSSVVSIAHRKDGSSGFDVLPIKGSELSNKEKKAKTMRDAEIAVAKMQVDDENGASPYRDKKWKKSLNHLSSALDKMYGLEGDDKSPQETIALSPTARKEPTKKETEKQAKRAEAAKIFDQSVTVTEKLTAVQKKTAAHHKEVNDLFGMGEKEEVDSNKIELRPIAKKAPTKEELKLEAHRAKATKIFNDGVTMRDKDKPVGDKDISTATTKEDKISVTVAPKADKRTTEVKTPKAVAVAEKQHEAATRKLDVSSKVNGDHHINRGMDKVSRMAGATGVTSPKEKSGKTSDTVSILERIAVATEAVRDALNTPGPTQSKK